MKKSIGHLYALICIMLWGFIGVFNKNLLANYSPFMLLMLELPISYLFLLIMNHNFFKVEFKKEVYFMLAGLFGSALYYFFNKLAYSIAPASFVSVILSISPIIIGILTVTVLKQGKMTKAFLIGFIVAILGIAMISFDGVTSLNVRPVGLFFAFIATFCMSIYTILLSKISSFGIESGAVARRCLFYGVIFVIPLLFLVDFEIKFAGLLQPANLIGLLYLGVFSNGLATFFWNKALASIGPMKAGVYMYASPAVGVLAAVACLGEKITVITIMGIILTIAGVVISGIKEKMSEQ